jgi:hypothetical protein
MSGMPLLMLWLRREAAFRADLARVTRGSAIDVFDMAELAGHYRSGDRRVHLRGRGIRRGRPPGQVRPGLPVHDGDRIRRA